MLNGVDCRTLAAAGLREISRQLASHVVELGGCWCWGDSRVILLLVIFRSGGNYCRYIGDRFGFPVLCFVRDRLVPVWVLRLNYICLTGW